MVKLLTVFTIVMALICLIFLIILSLNPETSEFTIQMLLKCISGIIYTCIIWIVSVILVIFNVETIYCSSDKEDWTCANATERENLNKNIEQLPDNITILSTIEKHKNKTLNKYKKDIGLLLDENKITRAEPEQSKIYYKAAEIIADQDEDRMIHALYNKTRKNVDFDSD